MSSSTIRIGDLASQESGTNEDGGFRKENSQKDFWAMQG